MLTYSFITPAWGGGVVGWWCMRVCVWSWWCILKGCSKCAKTEKQSLQISQHNQYCSAAPDSLYRWQPLSLQWLEILHLLITKNMTTTPTYSFVIYSKWCTIIIALVQRQLLGVTQAAEFKYGWICDKLTRKIWCLNPALILTRSASLVSLCLLEPRMNNSFPASPILTIRKWKADPWTKREATWWGCLVYMLTDRT